MKSTLIHCSFIGGAICVSSTVLAVSAANPPSLSQLHVRNDTSFAGQASSPPHYPSPWMDPQASGWEEAYIKAKAFVSQMTLAEKVNLTTGVG